MVQWYKELVNHVVKSFIPSVVVNSHEHHIPVFPYENVLHSNLYCLNKKKLLKIK